MSDEIQLKDEAIASKSIKDEYIINEEDIIHDLAELIKQASRLLTFDLENFFKQDKRAIPAYPFIAYALVLIKELKRRNKIPTSEQMLLVQKELYPVMKEFSDASDIKKFTDIKYNIEFYEALLNVNLEAKATALIEGKNFYVHELVGDNQHNTQLKFSTINKSLKDLPKYLSTTAASQVFAAIEAGNTETVKLLLNHGALVNYQTADYGLTPLYWAIDKLESKDKQNVQIEIIRILLTSGANPNLAAKNDETPLLLAARLKRVDICQQLINHDADFYAALQKASAEHNYLALTTLFKVASQNKKSALQLALEKRDIKFASTLLNQGANPQASDGQGETVLHYVVTYLDPENSDHCQFFINLMEKGASFDQEVDPSEGYDSDVEAWQMLWAAHTNPENKKVISLLEKSIQYYQLLTEESFQEWKASYIKDNKIEKQVFYEKAFELMDAAGYEDWQRLVQKFVIANSSEKKDGKIIAVIKQEIKNFLQKNPDITNYFSKFDQDILNYQNNIVNSWEIYSCKQDLLTYLTNYKNKTNNTVVKNLFGKIISSINGDAVDFTDDEQLLVSPQVSSRIFYLLGNLNNYQQIIPKQLQTIFAEPRQAYIALKAALDSNYAALEGEIKEKNLGIKDKEKLRIFGFFIKAILAYDNVEFSLADLHFISDIIPKNILKYESLLPSKIKTNLKNLKNLWECKNKIEKLDFLKMGFSNERKECLLQLFPKATEQPTSIKINTLIAASYVMCRSIDNPKDELAQVLEQSLINFFNIKSEDINDEEFVDSDLKFDLITKEINNNAKLKQLTETITVSANAIHLSDVKSKQKFFTHMNFFSAPTTKKIDPDRTKENFALIKQHIDLAPKIAKDKNLLCMQEIMDNNNNYLEKFSGFKLFHSRQGRLKYLNRFILNEMANYDKASDDNKKDVLKKVVLELDVHYESIIKYNKSSDVAKYLETALSTLLEIDPATADIRSAITNKLRSPDFPVLNYSEYMNLQDKIKAMDVLTQQESRLSHKLSIKKVSVMDFEKIGASIEANIEESTTMLGRSA